MKKLLAALILLGGIMASSPAGADDVWLKVANVPASAVSACLSRAGAEGMAMVDSCLAAQARFPGGRAPGTPLPVMGEDGVIMGRFHEPASAIKRRFVSLGRLVGVHPAGNAGVWNTFVIDFPDDNESSDFLLQIAPGEVPNGGTAVRVAVGDGGDRLQRWPVHAGVAGKPGTVCRVLRSVFDDLMRHEDAYNWLARMMPSVDGVGVLIVQGVPQNPSEPRADTVLLWIRREGVTADAGGRKRVAVVLGWGPPPKQRRGWFED